MGESDNMVSRFKQVLRQTREDDAEYQDLFNAPSRPRASRSVLSYEGPRGDRFAERTDKADKPEKNKTGKIRPWMIGLGLVVGLVVIFIVFRTLHKEKAANWLDKILRRDPPKPCGGELSVNGLPAYGSTHTLSQYGTGTMSPLRPPAAAAGATVWSPDMYTADSASAAPTFQAGPEERQAQGVSQAPQQDEFFTPDPNA